MRTTLTLDDDVVRLIDQEVKRSGESYKATVNRLLRIGAVASRRPRPAKVLKMKSFALGLRPGLNYDSISTLLEEAEGPSHR